MGSGTLVCAKAAADDSDKELELGGASELLVVATNDVGQSPPFALVNLVVVIERAFVGMAGDLNDPVHWLSAGFLQFCDNRLSGGMIGNSLSVYI